MFDDTLISRIFLTSYIFIRLPTPLMMNKNINWVQSFPFSLSHDNGSIVNPLICTHCILGLWNLCKFIRYLHKVYNVNILIVQDYFLWKNSIDFQKLARSFPFVKDQRHSTNTLLDDTLIPCIFLTSYMFIQLHTLLMMNGNIN